MKNDTQVDEEAAYWVEQLNRPVVDTAIAAGFDRWMLSSAKHRESFSAMQSLWDCERLSPAMRAADAQPAGAQPDDRAESIDRRTRAWRPMAGAAALAFAGVVAAVLWNPPQLTRTLRTPVGSGAHFELADGSQVDLSADSKLTVNILPWSRQATLHRGEMFVDVRHERFRRFTVHSDIASIDVLGTAFNIDRNRKGLTMIQVFRGVVAVDGPKRERMILRKGQSARVTTAGVSQDHLEIGVRPEWMSGWYDVSAVPLDQLVNKLNRQSDAKIRASSDVAALKISGRFHISQPRSVLSALQLGYGIKAQRRNGEIVLTQ